MGNDERVIWEADFFGGLVHQSATYSEGTRTVVLEEQSASTGEDASIVFEARDLREIVKRLP